MNSDLISREALKEEISSACYNCASRGEDDYNCKYHCPIYDFLTHIDNAPTVEIPVARWDCYCEGQKVGYEKALSERPQGEWVRTGQSFVNPNKFRNFCCSNCFWELDEHIRIEPNFCPNCGSEMRGKNDDSL